MTLDEQPGKVRAVLIFGGAVAAGIPNPAQYYGDFDYIYLDEEDPRYDVYVGPDGKTERWTAAFGEKNVLLITATGRQASGDQSDNPL